MLSVPIAFAVDCGRACLARAVAPLRCALRPNMARGTILVALDFLVLIQQLHEQSRPFVLWPQIVWFAVRESLQFFDCSLRWHYAFVLTDQVKTVDMRLPTCQVIWTLKITFLRDKSLKSATSKSLPWPSPQCHKAHNEAPNWTRSATLYLARPGDIFPRLFRLSSQQVHMVWHSHLTRS